MEMANSIADRLLVEKIFAREPGGATGFYSKYFGLVVSVVRRYLRDWTATEDVAQEAFSRAFQHLTDLKDVKSIRSWLSMIARRAFLTYCGDSRPPTDEVLLSTTSMMEHALTSMRRGSSRFARNFDMKTLMDRIPEPYRTTLIQRYYEDLPLPEVAKRQGIELPLAKYRVQQGLRLLKARFMTAGLTREDLV